MVEERRPLVEAGLTFGVTERMTADGTVLAPLDREAVDELGRRCGTRVPRPWRSASFTPIGTDAHEEAALEILERTASSSRHRTGCCREYREFERWSTTVVNAYVTPLMARYLSVLEQRLGSRRLSVMQSNGGSIAAATARAAAVRTILSGPAAGVVGARAVADARGLPANHHVRHGRHVDRREPRGRRDRR